MNLIEPVWVFLVRFRHRVITLKNQVCFLMIEKGIYQVIRIKNCDENSKLEHVILNGGST